MTQSDKNTLYYGDNLAILREYIADESVDLIYLDPPFNSKRTYNVLFKDESGQDSSAQIAAFDDTWHWDMAAEEAYRQLIEDSPNEVSQLIGALRGFVGANQMLAYLVMMAIRLIELHRVLKSTGSLYLHCDPTASHYLKIVLDAIFGAENFRNEIAWCYRKWSITQKQFVSNHDVILFYAKSEDNLFNTQYVPLSKGTMKRWKGKKQKAVFDDSGKRLASNEDEDSKGSPMPDWWEISILNPMSKERLGYPTQKPLELLERIVKASSRKGDVVLDPFCGCGTTIAAAEKLDRQWIGVDITHLAIALQKYRLQESFPEADFAVVGEPESVKAAEYLAKQDRFLFEWWELSLIKARPSQTVKGSKKRGKKGADRGIDGVINFIDGADRRPQQVLVQVKSGKVSSRDIRDLVGTVERVKGAIGVFITLKPPSKPMKTEAATAGFYESSLWGGQYPKIQILTIAALLEGASISMPTALRSFKQAERIDKNPAGQNGFEI